ncbi:dodecin family protein [Arachidicoccus terrestris]|uniref:dodecin family protein n=1 Tax=Arachidicoccus terrestris TaxID=2875539 RepID=UPI001CC37116|nr:dodecin family protein [Arachidicoccus terrestris]UAY54706.1 dodecin family protein [Arachidicoccus terrestris]
MAVLKVIEVMASSPIGWEDAAAQAVAEASKTLKGIRSVYVKEQSAVVTDNKISEYRVNLKISFTVEN